MKWNVLKNSLNISCTFFCRVTSRSRGTVYFEVFVLISMRTATLLSRNTWSVIAFYGELSVLQCFISVFKKCSECFSLLGCQHWGSWEKQRTDHHRALRDPKRECWWWGKARGCWSGDWGCGTSMRAEKYFLWMCHAFWCHLHTQPELSLRT